MPCPPVPRDCLRILLQNKLLTFATAILCSTFPWAPAIGATPPNVVLFLADDVGYGDLGCHGNPQVRTPRIDAFAREAAELANYRVSPVCAPTRASLMTGRYNFRTGVCDVFGAASEMDASEVTVAEALHAAGYVTGIFGKWHLGDKESHRPNAQGFDEALTFPGAALRKYFDPNLLHNGVAEKRKGYCMDIFTDAAIDFIRANRTKPFFVYLPANLIHTPLQVAGKLAAPYLAMGLSPSTAKSYGMLRSVDDTGQGDIDDAALRLVGQHARRRLQAALIQMLNGRHIGQLPCVVDEMGHAQSALPCHGLHGPLRRQMLRIPPGDPPKTAPPCVQCRPVIRPA